MRKPAILAADVLAAAALLAALSAGASARAGQHLCETSSPNLCVGAVTIGIGDPVTEQAGGRAIAPETMGSSIVLEFTGSGTCVAFPINSTQAENEPCTGTTGVLFKGTLVNGHWHFSNNHWGGNLAGQGCTGCQFELQPGGLGYLEAFDFS